MFKIEENKKNAPSPICIGVDLNIVGKDSDFTYYLSKYAQNNGLEAKTFEESGMAMLILRENLETP